MDWKVGEMIGFGATFRSARIGAVGALTLSCALGGAAETASGKSESTHATVPKKTTSTSSHPRHSTSSPSTGGKKSSVKKSSAKSTGKGSSRKKSSCVRGQQKIESERAQQILKFGPCGRGEMAFPLDPLQLSGKLD